MAGGFFRSLGERLAYPFVRMAEKLARPIREVADAISRWATRVEVGEIQRVEEAESRAIERSSEAMGIGEHELPDVAGIPEALTKLRKQFSWGLRSEYINRAGERVTRFLTVSSDRLLTPAEVMEEARRLLERDEYDMRDGGLISLEVESVRKAGPMGTL